MQSRHDLPNYIPSPVRRTPTQEFDYQELVADPNFHAVVDEHKKNGSFAGLGEGTPEYNARLKEIAVAFVGVVNEKRATLFRNRGILNGRRGAFREAISCYNRALELSNNSPSRHVTLANRSAAYIKSQKFPEALEDAQEAALLCSEYSIAHSLMGYCHSRLGMGKKAVVDYNVALQLNPADVSSQGLLAQAKKSLISAGETVETIEALEAPFVTKREQEIAAIQEATAAALEVPGPVRHKRYLDNAERAGSIQEMVKKAGIPIDAGRELRAKDLTGQDCANKPSRTNNGPEKQKRLSRKLSAGSAQAFSSLTKIPGKLKHVLGKKNTRSKGNGPGQALGSDFLGLYQNAQEDVADAPVPTTCQGARSALEAPEVSAADAPRGASNPLFCADRQRNSTSIKPAPAARGGTSASGVGVGVGSGGRAPGVFCATEPSAGGPVPQNSSSGNGGGPAVPASRDVIQQRRQRQERPQKQRLPPEAQPRVKRAQNTGERRPGAHTAVARQQEWSRRNSKDQQKRHSRPRSADDAREDSGGRATASLTPPSVKEDQGEKPSLRPPAPRPGQGQNKIPAKTQTTPPTGPQQNAPPMQTIVRRGIGPSWAPEKSGYASSESDFSEGSPVRSRAVAVEAAGGGGKNRVSSTMPKAATEVDQAFVNSAATAVVTAGGQPAVAKSSEKAGWTTSGSNSDNVSGSMAKDSGGDPLRFDASATTEIVMGDEEGIVADRALRIVLDGDSDCASVYESITGRGGKNAAVEEKAQAAETQTQTPWMELLRADAQASRGKLFSKMLEAGGGIAHRPAIAQIDTSVGAKLLAQGLGGGATASDRRPAGREVSVRGYSPTAAGDIASSMFAEADTAKPESSPRLKSSVRAKIEMFERSARSLSLGGEEANLKVSMGRMATPGRLSRSFSEKVRAHGIAVSAATTSSNRLPAALGPGRLSRSQSFQIPPRTRPLPAAMATTDAHGADNGV